MFPRTCLSGITIIEIFSLNIFPWGKLCDCWTQYIHLIVPFPMLIHSWKEEWEVKRQEPFCERNVPSHSCWGNLLSWPSQKALKEDHNGSEVICSWHYLCYYFVFCLLLWCCSNWKKQLVLQDAVFSLGWSESSNTHSAKGVEIRVWVTWRWRRWHT